MNHIHYTKKNFIIGDFFEVVSKLKRQGKLFDCVILDPPFFSKTKYGIVDLEHNPVALLNKVRPLVADNGIIAIVNNSLYLSGRDYLNAIDVLCDDKYLIRQNIITVPDDFTGWDSANFHGFIVDPDPFNYPTKIVVLKVHRKFVSKSF